MVVDRDEVAALARDEIEDVAELTRPVGDEHAHREVAARAGQPEPHHRDERRRVDVSSGEHDRDRVVSPGPPVQQRGEPDRAGALDEQLLALEAEDERVRDLLVRDLDDVVERPVEDRAGQLAARLDRDPVRDRETRLADDADDPLSRSPLAQRERDPRREPAAADRDQDRLRIAGLLRELEPDRSLAGDHARVLEGVHECRAGALDVLLRRRDRPLEARRPRARPAPPYARVASTFAIGASSGMKIVAAIPASRAAHATACPWLPALAATTPAARSFGRERRDRVVGAADLERARALEVLGLEEHRATGEPRERLRRVERRLARDPREPLARRLDVGDRRRFSQS